ncbi:MAG: hypothetical protein U0746_04505 [Gemmataceae bacterium]
MNVRNLRITGFVVVMTGCCCLLPHKASGRSEDDPGKGGKRCGDIAGFDNGKCTACKNIFVDGVFIHSRSNEPVSTYKICETMSSSGTCTQPFTYTCGGVFYTLQDCQGERNGVPATTWTEATCGPLSN